MTATEFISPAEITRRVKGALRKAFPGSKSRVSTRHGIKVEWTDDGPTAEQVQHALLKAECAEMDEPTFDGRPRFKGPGGESYWFERYNEAKRAATVAEWERRHQEDEERRQRQQAAINAAYKAKHAAARAEAEPILPQQSSDPAAFEVFEALRERAEVDVSTSSESERQRRPSWAPPLIIEGELLEACRELGYLGKDDKPVVRLWAQFADPKKKGTSLREQRSRHPLAGIVCRGFQLHAGSERGPLGSMLFEAQRQESGEWRFGPKVYVSDDGPRSPRSHEWERLIRAREGLLSPADTERIDREIAEIDAKDLEDQRTYRRRKWLRQRAIELARARVLEFAGAPGMQMQAASRLWGHCFNCSKTLSDPTSLERGIGPDCLVGKIEHIHYVAPYLGRELPGLVPPRIVTLERIVFWTAMPLEFVKAPIDEMPVDASGRRIRPERKKPAPIDTADAITIVLHSAVFGTTKHVVREWKVTDVKPYAQYPIAVHISFVEPRQRKWASYTIVPDNIRFTTVERGGQVLYDTHKTVPIDMTAWEKTASIGTNGSPGRRKSTRKTRMAPLGSRPRRWATSKMKNRSSVNRRTRDEALARSAKEARR
jgi:Family of unknown function (DUF6011)